MALQNWVIEIRIDLDDPKKAALAGKLVRSHGKTLLTEFQLLADRRKPDIAIHTNDIFIGREEISLFEEGELDSL